MLSAVCSETGCCQLKLNFPPRAGGSLGNPILWALSYVHKRRRTQTMLPRTQFDDVHFASKIALSCDTATGGGEGGKNDNFVVSSFPRVVVKYPAILPETSALEILFSSIHSSPVLSLVMWVIAMALFTGCLDSIRWTRETWWRRSRYDGWRWWKFLLDR